MAKKDVQALEMSDGVISIMLKNEARQGRLSDVPH